MIIGQAEEMNPMHRSTMEDCCVHRAPEFFKKNGSKRSWNFLGVYDGHGGRDQVDFLEDALVENVRQELFAEDDAPVLERIERAFLLTDIQSYQEGLMTSGATVICCLIECSTVQVKSTDSSTDKNHMFTIYTANCGDARAVICTKDGKSHRLSCDHKAEDPSEIKRIEQAGGFVLRNRVLGILAVSRSLGDHGMKDFVIGRPHLSEFNIEIASTEVEHTIFPFVILACDGVWDVLSDQEAVDIVREYICKNSTSNTNLNELSDTAAQMIVDEAMKRGSTDNISIIIGWF